MTGTKKTYAELLAERNKLQSKVEQLQRALTETGRHRVVFHAMDWYSMPLHQKQQDIVEEYFSNRLAYDDYKRHGDERHYEEIRESDILPEFRHYLIRYATDLQGNMISAVKVWGLIPV